MDLYPIAMSWITLSVVIIAAVSTIIWSLSLIGSILGEERVDFSSSRPVDTGAGLTKSKTSMKLPEFMRQRLLTRCSEIMNSREPDVRIGPSREDPYMKRWWYIRRNFFFNIYLHCIRHDDDDRAKHDHPAVSLSIVLDEGYTEQMHAGTFERTPGDLVLRFSKTMHRIEVHKNADGTVRPAITIWVTGPKLRYVPRMQRDKWWRFFGVTWWGFECPKKWVHWKTFLDGDYNNHPDGISRPGRGCGEYA